VRKSVHVFYEERERKEANARRGPYLVLVEDPCEDGRRVEMRHAIALN
jgi:hypothetical protein